MNNIKQRVLTGDRPTGKLHLGHYVGSLVNRLDLQNEYETFILVADVQALTDNFSTPSKIKENILETTIDNLAVGLDPEKVIFYLQSKIPQTSELTMYLMNLVSLEEVLRNPTVKDEVQQKKSKFKGNPPFGFIGYPINQAADILTPKAELIPVGDDQAPMIELTNVILERFNSIYNKEVFKKVKPIFSKTPRLVGLDGNQKMSKSLDNAIFLADSPIDVKNKIMSMYTDPNRIRASDPGNVEGNPLFIYHDIFNPNKEEVEDFKDRYRKGKVGDVEVKNSLISVINEFLEPIREKRNYYSNNLHLVEQILREGENRCRTIAEKTLSEVKNAIGLDY